VSPVVKVAVRRLSPKYYGLWLWVPAFAGTTIRTQLRDLAACFARGLREIPCPPRSEGAGKAGCRLHPRVPCKKSTGVGPQVQPETSGFPRAMVYGLFRALPGDRAFLPPSSLGSFPRNLMPASGHQDHTTSPSASRALVFGTVSVHRIPLRVRDVAQRPSVWGGMNSLYSCFYQTEKRIIFSRGAGQDFGDLPVGLRLPLLRHSEGVRSTSPE
jgi:hypothetical protein